jgi:hypothetical protein
VFGVDAGSQVGHGIGIGNVAAVGDGYAAADRSARLGSLLRRDLVDVDGEQTAASLGERPGGGRADAATRPRDEDHRPIEVDPPLRHRQNG